MTWSVVCTTNALARDIARFAAHHLSLGCDALFLFLETPLEDAAHLSHPRLHLRRGSSEHDALHRRQMANASRAYADARTGWIAHLDVDEFILAREPFDEALAALPAEVEWVRLAPVEPLCPSSGPIRHYKRAPQQAGLPRSTLEALYPEHGLMLRSGLIAHAEGKPMIRTGLEGARVGIHKLLGRGKIKPARLPGTVLAHHHAPGWPEFKAALPTRLANGSYASARATETSMAELIALLRADGGEAALKHLYTTLRADTAEHRNALEMHGLLLQHDLDLDNKAKALFPALFPGETS